MALGGQHQKMDANPRRGGEERREKREEGREKREERTEKREGREGKKEYIRVRRER